MGKSFLGKPEDDKGAAWPAIMVGLFASFGGILYGYDTGTISGIQSMPYWEYEFFPDLNTKYDSVEGYVNNNVDLSTSSGKISLIVSILSIGTFVGALSAGILADKTGRKWGIILSAGIPFNIGVIMQVAATSQPLFIAGRFFAGLGVGLVSVQVPMYQSETLPKWIRGFVVGCYQLCITIGLLLSAIVNNSTANRLDSGSYRIPLAVQFLWSIILCVGMFILPETPRFLIKQGQEEKAKKSLKFLRRLEVTDPGLIAEYDEIRANYEYEQSLGKASYAELFRGTVGKRVITGITLQSLQQLVGVNFIFYYGTAYFKDQNPGALPAAFTCTIITNVVNVLSTFPGLVAIDRFGRRPVLLAGALGMGICQYLVAATGAATSTTNNASIQAQFAFICVYIFFFASTWGPGAWVVTSEMFPLRARARGLSLTTAANWFFNWLLAFITPYLTGVGYANLKTNIFWIWGGFCWIAVAFVFFMIYETKNLTLEEVSELYETTSKAWKSRQFRPAVKWSEIEQDESGRKMSVTDIRNLQERRRSTHAGSDYEKQ